MINATKPACQLAMEASVKSAVWKTRTKALHTAHFRTAAPRFPRNNLTPPVAVLIRHHQTILDTIASLSFGHRDYDGLVALSLELDTEIQTQSGRDSRDSGARLRLLRKTLIDQEGLDPDGFCIRLLDAALLDLIAEAPAQKISTSALRTAHPRRTSRPLSGNNLVLPVAVLISHNQTVLDTIAGLPFGHRDYDGLVARSLELDAEILTKSAQDGRCTSARLRLLRKTLIDQEGLDPDGFCIRQLDAALPGLGADDLEKVED